MRAALLLAGGLALSGCGALSRLSEVGRPPGLSPVTSPTADPNWRPVTMPAASRPGANTALQPMAVRQPGVLQGSKGSAGR